MTSVFGVTDVRRVDEIDDINYEAGSTAVSVRPGSLAERVEPPSPSHVDRAISDNARSRFSR